MNDIVLPKLAPNASPDFVDAAASKAWVENVPLANIPAAQRQLLEAIEEFNRFPTKAANRLAVMETLREAVHFVQMEQAKRFTNRALPMVENEIQVFKDTVALWQQMHIGYLRCIDAVGDGEPGMRVQAALVCQRALAYSGLKMFHHYRAYRQVPSREWAVLHRVYARSEALGVGNEPVKDYMNRDVHDTSPRVAYVRAVLMGMCNPNELAQRQITFVAFLLERWADRVEIVAQPVGEADIPELVVDLASDRCAERMGGAQAAVPMKEPRYLDARRLAKTLRNRIGLLRKGESPAKLALGEDCVQPACEQMLVFLYRQWYQPRPTRGLERRGAGSAAEVCNGMAAIHYHISGQVFRQPGKQSDLSKREREEIATFGRISTRHEDDYSESKGIVLERWKLEDESAQGLKMLRPAGDPGKRYAHGQLVGVRPADSKSFMLGQVRWLMIDDKGDLYAGVRVLPGLPAAVAVRPTGVNAMNEPYVPGLSLTGVPALNSPPSVVLPTGWYRPKRVIEVFVDAPVRVLLAEVIERGADFERVAYEILP
ncbi:MAG: hypothetical protein ACM3IK_11260 [Sphingomonadaceae bacterium]